MQHDNQIRKSTLTLRQRLHPGRIVTLCFVTVLIFSTLLTWREAVVLEDAYISSQRNYLDSVANTLDRQLEYSVDKLLFFRNAMHDSLKVPLVSARLQQSIARFSSLRTRPWWQLTVNEQRTLPLNGVSDDFVTQTITLARDDARLSDEMSAAFEAGNLMRISSPLTTLAKRVVYASRAGFYLSTDASERQHDITSRYYQLVTSPWFTRQSERNNSARSVRWFTRPGLPGSESDRIITVSVPVDYQHYWYGVLAIDFTLATLRDLLKDAVGDNGEGEFQLYDSRLALIATSQPDAEQVTRFDAQELARIAGELQHDNEGGLHLGSRYVNWQRMDHFDGVLLRVHTLAEGANGNFGRITIALTLLWLLFTGMLIGSWLVIRRMVSNMYNMQHSLQWQAWHDPMTRLLNRGALFERAKSLAERCRQRQQPFSVIQMDLDHFKGINDRYGHQAGDKVLIHSAGLIAASLRDTDVAGRIGGEEFCVILPDTTLAQAGQVAERIRARINRREVLVKRGQTVCVSVSIGVSSAQERDIYDFEQLQSIADARLYQAKQGGRNRVIAQDDKK